MPLQPRIEIGDLFCSLEQSREPTVEKVVFLEAIRSTSGIVESLEERLFLDEIGVVS